MAANVSRDDGPSTSEADPKEAEAPWYLEVEPPRHPTLVAEPPPLPDIPSGSPPLMGPMVKLVSDDLGLDDLTLLDLRELHPPPALGPQLLMLFGTARNERHLHVSSDRLVRWLRARGVTAQADGLLGRNELKTRLRRKARKAKLLGHSTGFRDADDGIGTGWICVNLGTSGWTDGKVVEMFDESGVASGFGVPRTGTTIVVQLMTESRRKELDLETLWTRQLERCLKARAKLENSSEPPPQISQTNKATTEDSDELLFARELESQSLPAHNGGSQSPRSTLQQRWFSSSSRRRMPDQESNPLGASSPKAVAIRG